MQLKLIIKNNGHKICCKAIFVRGLKNTASKSELQFIRFNHKVDPAMNPNDPQTVEIENQNRLCAPLLFL